MRKRDKLREKRQAMWDKMDERKAQRKAEGGLCMMIAMIFVLTGLHFCSPDFADAKSSSSRSSSSRSSSSKSYSPTKTVIVKKQVVVQNEQPMQLAKQPVKPVVNAPVGAKRPMKKGMYYKGNLVCKKDKWTGREKCKSKTAYFFDDVLDADDWFEDDDDDYRPQYNTQPSQTNSADVAIAAMWGWFMMFVIVAAMIVLFFMSRRK